MFFVIITWNVINAMYKLIMHESYKEVVRVLVFGNYWYLYMLLGLYLLIPIINCLLKNYRKTQIPRYVIILTLLYELYLSYSLLLPEMVYGYASKLVSKLMLSLITGYTGFLFLGFLLRREHENIFLKKWKLCFKVLTIIVAILAIGLLVCAINAAVINNGYNYIYFDEFTAMVLAGVIFFLFMKIPIQQETELINGEDGCFKKMMKTFSVYIYKFVGTHSLGMYVVSNIFLDILKKSGITIEMYRNIAVGMLSCWLLIVVPTSLVVWGISKTKLRTIV